MRTAQGTDRDRRVWRTKYCRADSGYRAPSERCKNRQAVGIRSLSLIGSHAQCRVALEVLDGLEAFARCQLHILPRDIVLEIDECLVLAPIDVPKGRHPLR